MSRPPERGGEGAYVLAHALTGPATRAGTHLSPRLNRAVGGHRKGTLGAYATPLGTSASTGLSPPHSGGRLFLSQLSA